MKERELATFCKELAIMVRAGMTLEETMEFMEQDNEDDRFKQLIKKIKIELENGKSIERALESTQEFPQYMLCMIKIGLNSKALDEVLDLLSHTYRQNVRIKEKLKRAINYPIYLGSIMCIILLFLILKVMPIMEEVFAVWNEDMTETAKFFLGLSTQVSRCTVIVFIGSVILLVLGVFLVKTNKGRQVGIHLLGYTSISEKMDIARFVWIMGLLLEGNLNIEESLQRSAHVVVNKGVQQRIKRCIQLVSEKVPFDEAVIESKIFSKVMTRIIVTAFKNNQLKNVLKELGEDGQKNVQYALENKIMAIETLSVGMTSIFIGSILVTIMLSLISMITML